MKQLLVIFFIFFLWAPLSAKEKKITDHFEFNGYIQIRGMSNFDDYAGFALRRLKLWIKSKPAFSAHWSYKIQATFSSYSQEKFFLQDVKIGYKTGQISFDLGQFVPQYSLQRFQHDYQIPPIERARVVNTLIPDGTLGVRDIGVQINFTSSTGLFETHLGLFNGYGIKEYRFNNKGVMISNKNVLNFPFQKNEIKLGFSLQYRSAENLPMRDILADSILYSGKDVRQNLFFMFKGEKFNLQAEYLNANFKGQRAYGYYFLSSVNFEQIQLVFSYEYYKDLIEQTADNPYYRIGFNYLIHDYKIKLAFDNYFQIVDHQIKRYRASIQLQLFLNQ